MMCSRLPGGQRGAPKRSSPPAAEWLRRRYPVRETVFANDEFMITKIPL